MDFETMLKDELKKLAEKNDIYIPSRYNKGDIVEVMKEFFKRKQNRESKRLSNRIKRKSSVRSRSPRTKSPRSRSVRSRSPKPNINKQFMNYAPAYNMNYAPNLNYQNIVNNYYTGSEIKEIAKINKIKTPENASKKELVEIVNAVLAERLRNKTPIKMIEPKIKTPKKVPSMKPVSPKRSTSNKPLAVVDVNLPKEETNRQRKEREYKEKMEQRRKEQEAREALEKKEKLKSKSPVRSSPKSPVRSPAKSPVRSSPKSPARSPVRSSPKSPAKEFIKPLTPMKPIQPVVVSDVNPPKEETNRQRKEREYKERQEQQRKEREDRLKKEELERKEKELQKLETVVERDIENSVSEEKVERDIQKVEQKEEEIKRLSKTVSSAKRPSPSVKASTRTSPTSPKVFTPKRRESPEFVIPNVPIFEPVDKTEEVFAVPKMSTPKGERDSLKLNILSIDSSLEKTPSYKVRSLPRIIGPHGEKL
jgi:hypothetical protein